jgi:hypothetical protein
MKSDQATLARVYAIRLGGLYPIYCQKIERKGRTKAELDEVLCWLTGHTPASLKRAVASGVDLQAFFATAPSYNPKAGLITGVVCGVRVEDITDRTMRQVRQMDKLVDELAKGKAMEKILRK